MEKYVGDAQTLLQESKCEQIYFSIVNTLCEKLNELDEQVLKAKQEMQ